jgi:hypothetical protein
MKKIHLVIFSTIVTGIMLLNLEIINTYLYGQENVDRNIIPLLTPPYQSIGDFQSTDLKNFNITYVNDIP